MKKQSALMIAAGVISLSMNWVSAVSLNPKGLGQVLIYPYYTVNRSHDTFLSIGNASDIGKAVKVRFREGYNGRDVRDFNLFLSPHDVWAATISAANDASGAQLKWTDHSCTLGLSMSPSAFSADAYDGTLTPLGLPKDSGPSGITRTREGFFEVIAMGDVAAGSTLATVITHSQPGEPNQGEPPCGAPLVDGQVIAAGLAPPTSGLFGSAGIIDVGEGIFYSYDAIALTGFYGLSQGNLYTNPGSLSPTLQSAVDDEAENGVARAHLATDSGRALALDYDHGYDATSSVLMADTLYNDYLVSPAIGATTDWVVTFPTKQFYVDTQVYPNDSPSRFSPFDTAFANGRSDVSVKYDVYDREEAAEPVPNCTGGSPDCLQSPIKLGYQVNVIEFQTAAADFLGSQLAANIAPFGDSGWVRFDLGGRPDQLLQLYRNYMQPGRNTDGSFYVNGLPAVGFMVYDIINAQAQPGKLANYSGLFPHHGSMSCGGAPVPSVNICP